MEVSFTPEPSDRPRSFGPNRLPKQSEDQCKGNEVMVSQDNIKKMKTSTLSGTKLREKQQGPAS